MVLENIINVGKMKTNFFVLPLRGRECKRYRVRRGRKTGPSSKRSSSVLKLTLSNHGARLSEDSSATILAPASSASCGTSFGSDVEVMVVLKVLVLQNTHEDKET